MVKSIIRDLFTAEAAVVDTLGVQFITQRLVDETGAIQVQVNQDPDPGGGSLGKVVIEGRLDPAATYVEIAKVSFLDFDGGSGSGLSKVVSNVDILPDMRAAMRSEAGFSVVAMTTVDMWVQE